MGLARYIYKEEIENIVESIKSNSRHEKRDLALVYLGFTTALRSCELRDLNVGNVFDENFNVKEDCYIFAKQSKGNYGEGNLYIFGDKVKQALKDYIEERRYEAERYGFELTLESPLFISQRNNKRFKSNSITKWMATIFKKKAGLKGQASSHACRRTFASNFYEKNRDVKALQIALRLKSPEVAMRYVYRDPLLIKRMWKESIID